MHRWCESMGTKQSHIIYVAHHADTVKSTQNRFSSILLVGIVLGNGTQEAHDLNPYIDIMVDELLEMSSSTMFDDIPCK